MGGDAVNSGLVFCILIRLNTALVSAVGIWAHIRGNGALFLGLRPFTEALQRDRDCRSKDEDDQWSPPGSSSGASKQEEEPWEKMGTCQEAFVVCFHTRVVLILVSHLSLDDLRSLRALQRALWSIFTT